MFGNSVGRKNLTADERGQKTTPDLVCTDREAMISQVTGLHSCDKQENKVSVYQKAQHV